MDVEASGLSGIWLRQEKREGTEQDEDSRGRRQGRREAPAMGQGTAGLGNRRKAWGPMRRDGDDGDLREARATPVRASVAPPTLARGRPLTGWCETGTWVDLQKVNRTGLRLPRR